jgi:hypothetical protein
MDKYACAPGKGEKDKEGCFELIKEEKDGSKENSCFENSKQESESCSLHISQDTECKPPLGGCQGSQGPFCSTRVKETPQRFSG